MSDNDLIISETERALVNDLQSQDAATNDKAWERVYRNCFPIVREFVCKNNGAVDDAIDNFQDGLLIVHRNINNGVFRGQASLKTYIFNICRNLWLKELQKRQKHQVTLNDMTDYWEHQDVTNYLLSVEIITLLMNELKEDCRRILTEYYYNNKSMAELKEMFKVNSIQAAKNKKLRCMGYLVNLCKERGITPSLYN